MYVRASTKSKKETKKNETEPMTLKLFWGRPKNQKIKYKNGNIERERREQKKQKENSFGRSICMYVCVHNIKFSTQQIKVY